MAKCPKCGKEYEYQYRVKYNCDGIFMGCEHDGEFVASPYECDSIKKQRDKHAKDIVQPNNKHFDKLYPNTFL